MCRIISIHGKISYKKLAKVLCEFQKLAKYGKIPRGASRGHKDGWGIVAYKKGQPFLFVRDHKNAFNNPKYLQVIKSLENKGADVIISHLRKASVGMRNVRNTHPFSSGAYSFCQNGTVFESNKISLKAKYKKIIKGTSDSEKLFAYILQALGYCKCSKTIAIRKAIKKAINYIRNNFDFTAMNIIFSDGNYVWALREVNEKNKFVREHNLINYYSLFTGSSENQYIVCSEKLPLDGIKWKTLKNHELLEISLRSNKVKKFFV
jgi:predicted glutamine amidotransferase